MDKPTKTLTKKAHEITLQLPDKLHKDLKKVVNTQGRQLVKVVTKAIEDYVAEQLSVTVVPAKPIGEALLEMPYKRVQDLGLTREQVDPDFKGTPTEFTAKYGHVTNHTKSELEFNESVQRASILCTAMRKFIDAEMPGVTLADIDNWIKADPGYRSDKFRKRALEFHTMVEKLKPVLEEFLTR